MDFALFGIVFSVIAGLLIFITLGCEGMYDYWKNEMPRKDKLKIRNSFIVAGLMAAIVTLIRWVS